jgi:DNA-binding XRE family transcriptional regulator
VIAPGGYGGLVRDDGSGGGACLSFAGLLRQFRAEARLTQEELAGAAGLRPRSVSDLERGINRTARKDTAVLLADALSLTGQVRVLFVAAARGRAPAAEVLAASPNPSSSFDILDGVSCASSSGCIAVGRQGAAGASTHTLAEKWDGTAWKAVSTLNPSKRFDELLGVSCFSPANCAAVGEQGGTATLTESWNGLSWNAPATPDPSPVEDILSGVSCPNASTCQAAGSYDASFSMPVQTLLLSASTPVPVITKFSPASGPAGTSVTITGSHLAGVTRVTFNGTAATITSAIPTKLVVKVPHGATTGKIKVTTPGGTAASATSFKVT